jgi:hypothetical protein
MRTLALLVVGLLYTSLLHAQPAPPGLPPLLNRETVVMPGETCASQNTKCLGFCATQRSGTEAVTGCQSDCEWRLNYCKNETGLYPWRNSKSVWVGKRE